MPLESTRTLSTFAAVPTETAATGVEEDVSVVDAAFSLLVAGLALPELSEPVLDVSPPEASVELLLLPLLPQPAIAIAAATASSANT